MSLTSGACLGPYEIVALVGAGGMGEVYQARDTRLDRAVALKVLPPRLATDAQFRTRFDREARALSGLDHPHICPLYDVGEQDGTAYLVMPLLDGETLAQRLTRGPLPVPEALGAAAQIADALDRAHRAGIVHRDLKPGNVMLTRAGVKLLDFGLAKAARSGVVAAGAEGPTAPATVTGAGTIIGTLQYMAPEQIEGREADVRSDIFAFGCVLFEMLTGNKAFSGATHASLIGAILKDDPPRVSNVQPLNPVLLDHVIATCCAKSPEDRWQCARDLSRELQWIAGTSSLGGSSAPAPRPRGHAWTRPLPWLAAAIIAGAGMGVLLLGRSGGVNPAPLYASIELPQGYVLGEDDFIMSLPTRTPMVFTPDGRALIIQAARGGKPQLFIRRLDRPDVRPIAGTEDAHVPFVSPDGKWLGFWAANEIRKVPIDGGTPTTICRLDAALGPYGASWGTRGLIAFGDEASSRIMTVSAAGGEPTPVSPAPSIGRADVAPFFLPDGQRILFSEVSGSDANDSRLMVESIDRGVPRVVMAHAADGRLVPSGRLAFMRVANLMTVPFDAIHGRVTGSPEVAIHGVMQDGLSNRAGAANTAEGSFTVSSLGALAFVPGPLVTSQNARLIWATRDGHTSSAEPAAGAPVGSRMYARISPDGSRAVTGVLTSQRRGLWFADWPRDLWTNCDPCATDTFLGVWSPDGTRLLIRRQDRIVMHTIDGSVPDRVVVEESGRITMPESWLPDGRILYQSVDGAGRPEIKLWTPGTRSARTVVPLDVGTAPMASPDGRWVAYDTNSDSPEVVVQALPGPAPHLQISAGGGYDPLWSPDGRTLYYIRRYTNPRSQAIMAVDLATSPTLHAGKARELFRRPDSQICLEERCYDISRDGTRFLLHEPAPGSHVSVTRMTLVLNWTATLAGR
ncbi:MAG TPA: protein kinase [Vicinamibacterales bacterium]|nr:protein kinase [Vicinamibacterales bacterium]